MNLTAFISGEFKRLYSSPKRLMITFGLPILLFLFFGYTFKENTPTELPVLVTDYDQSVLSRQLIRYLDATSIMRIEAQAESLQSAQTRLRTGEVYAYIVIPSGFEADILQSKTTKAICYTNGNYLLPSGFIQTAFLSTVGTLSAGININKRTKQGVGVSQALAEVQPIRNDAHSLYNPYKNYKYFLSLGFIPMMFQMVVMIVSIFALGQMFKYRTSVQAYNQAGNNAWILLVGKLLPYTVSFLFLAFLMDFYLFKVLEIPSKTNFAVGSILISLLLVLVNQVLAVFFVSFCKDLRMALTFGGGFTAIAFSFSGYTFPLEAMPEAVQYVARCFPFTHFLQSYINTAVRGLSLFYSWENLLAFGIFSCTLLVSFPKFVKLVKQNGYETT
ncbi:ABC transporter permease [Capnocytophaga sp.]|uniref:ABC transporter permease n=1 Tax=Capnocytophaga sp. TaxID=44737 RepID=UPI0026DCF141|nr:ABC transporter permease [Capnocytophaga sp.]MDO5105921.1 ABC transporter permease [Capnocytophaga sp.]